MPKAANIKKTLEKEFFSVSLIYKIKKKYINTSKSHEFLI